MSIATLSAYSDEPPEPGDGGPTPPNDPTAENLPLVKPKVSASVH